MKHTNRLIFALLAAAALLFAAACSDSSDDDSISTSDLTGATWSASFGEETVATLSFASDGTVYVWILDEGEGECDYAISGSTVTITADGETLMQLTYSSSQLTGSFSGVSLTFTKS